MSDSSDRPAGSTEQVLVERFRNGAPEDPTPDDLIVEELLSIELDGTLVATTMRTPGHDVELAAGYCATEGLLGGAAIRSCRHRAEGADGAATDPGANVVSVDTGGAAPAPLARLTSTSSSCGLCGTTSIDALTTRLAPMANVEPFPLELLASLPDRARPEQRLFALTGGVHAAAAFDRSGAVVTLHEDIGRHNAVDKVIGRLLLDGHLATDPDDPPSRPASDMALYVSGRASFEMVQKAWAGGFAAVVAVSAPSALAVRTADVGGLQLAGFARDGRLNLYAHGAGR